MEEKNGDGNSRSFRHSFIGEHKSISKLRSLIPRIRESETNVLITGETGTGKEIIARMLRKTLLNGAKEPFLCVDSATIQNSMAESQLFGHEKGAFTGAEICKKGIFEEANGGVVYFDELANMPPEIQAKLLRVIQEKEVTRLGSNTLIPLSFRVICATNKDLTEIARAGNFKEDLYQRLSTIPLHIPPLRERSSDIPLLVDHFLSRMKRKLNLTDESMNILMRYNWPGNVRELQNLLSYLATLSPTNLIDPSDLPPNIRETARNHVRPPSLLEPEAGRKNSSFYAQVRSFEKKLLEREYESIEGNISKLALKLQMDRSHLYTKLKLYRSITPSERDHSHPYRNTEIYFLIFYDTFLKTLNES